MRPEGAALKYLRAADQFLAALFGQEVRDLGYYRLAEAELDGMPLVVTRTGWSGQLGYEIFLRDGAFGDALWEAILEAGRPHGMNFGLTLSLWDYLFGTACIPEDGRDIELFVPIE